MPDPRDHRVAIVGMAASFPGAPDLETFARNIETGVDAITDVPASRWDAVFYDPDASAPDRFYCKRGGFVSPTFDPVAFGIMPVAASGAEPDQLLALQTASRALDDAGCAIPRDRTGVILGRGGYLTPGMARLSLRVRTAQQLVTTLAELVPDLDAQTLDKIRAAFRAKAGELGPDAAIGLVPNLAASRIANRLDLHGPAYTVDAACASSLLAVDQACRELAERRCDLMIAGGVHVCHDVTFWSVFTQLGALSRTQVIRPLDRRADGILIGEGAGLVVLKRLADAERDNDRIYAVVCGVGVASDGRESSPMRPRLDGQRTALDRAWRTAEVDPATVGLVEAHGTGTPTGDEIELRALGQHFGESSGARAALGSVKSMIGHTMPAAGAAGLIKTALAIHRGVLPPTLHCEEPHPELARTRFRVLAKAEPWESPVRRAGVSAFGFGGINAHVVVESHASSKAARRRSPSSASPSSGETTSTGRAVLASGVVIDVARVDDSTSILAISGASLADVRAALDEIVRNGLDATLRGDDLARNDNAVRGDDAGPVRLAMLDPTPDRIAKAVKVVDRGRAWRGNQDIWLATAPLGGTIAFVFPGVEAAFAPNAADVAARLGVALPAAIADAGAGDQLTARDLERRGMGVFALGRLLATALARMGIAPHAIAGHSLGEWTGMVESQMIPPDAAEAFVGGLRADTLEVPDVVFAAVGCGAGGAADALAGLPAIAVSHDNCPHQSIVCGRRDSVRATIERLAARGVLCQELPFRSGFHSPLFEGYLAPHRKHLAELALQQPRVPLWSATTCAPYPDEPDEIRELAIRHLVQPVRFRELVEALHASGVRAFVQLGVGNVAGFIDDTLRDRDHLAIAAGTPKHTGLSQLARVSAALFADGFVDAISVDLAAPVPEVTDDAVTTRVRTDELAPRARPTIALDLGAPLVRLAGAVPPITRGPAFPDVDSPVVAELVATFREAADASRAVVDAWRNARSSRRAAAVPRERVIRRRLSVDSDPALLDHCFYRQPDGWPTVSDRYPVVPMTMTIAMMIDAAQAHAGKLAVALEDVRAYRWLAVAPPVDIEIKSRLDGDRVDVEIPGYSRATVRLADRYDTPPAPALAPLANPRATPVTAERLYVDRWMFHGPQYQGVVAIGPLGDDGVDGTIEVLPAPGALLDCAGQLMGWWVMNHEDKDRLAMPVRIERVRLFGPEPGVGTRVDCKVRMRALGEREVRADLELVANGRVWASITNWEDRRFDSDDPVWAVLMYPERNALAEVRGEYCVVGEHWQAAASRELMMRRYLGEAERARFEQIGARKRRGWLLGRIAIKDACRLHLWNAGEGPVFPVEVSVDNEPSGKPTASVRGRRLHVSVAHKDDLAVAIVAADTDVGIDLERIQARAATFDAVAFTPAELALGAGRPHDEWQTRLWAAKEAVGKARGTGLSDPKRVVVRAVDGDRLTIDDSIVETRRDGDYIVAWTTSHGRPAS